MKINNHLKSFIHGSAVSMVGVGVLGILNYLIRKILSDSLTQQEFGFFYSVMAVVMMVMVFVDLGLGQAVVILIARSLAGNDKLDAGKVYTINLLIKLGLSLPVFLVMALFAPTLNQVFWEYPEGSVALYVLLLLIPFQAIQSAPMSVMIACKAFGIRNILDCVKAGLTLAGIVLLVRVYGLAGVSWVFVLSGALTFFWGAHWVRRKNIHLQPLGNLHFSNVKTIFSLSSWIAISTAGISVMYYMDTVCLTWLKDLESVALYNIALPIMQIAQSFFVFPAVFTPYATEMWHHGDYRGLKRSCIMGNLLMLATLPFFIIAGHYGGAFIIRLLFSAEYEAAAPAVTILWCGMVFFAMAGFNMNVLNCSGRQRLAALMIIACIIVNFILNVIFIPGFDYVGAALATAITYLIMALCSIVILLVMLRKSDRRL
jgi:O-antigen/teichoic acid export membrane protein